METFEDVKRKITIGTKLKAIHHKHKSARGYVDKDLGIRTITRTEKHGFWALDERNKEVMVNYTSLPLYKIIDKDTFTLGDNEPVLTYKFID